MVHVRHPELSSFPKHSNSDTLFILSILPGVSDEPFIRHKVVHCVFGLRVYEDTDLVSRSFW